MSNDRGEALADYVGKLTALLDEKTRMLESAHSEIVKLSGGIFRLVKEPCPLIQGSAVDSALALIEDRNRLLLQIQELQKRQARPCVEPGCDNTAMRCKDHPYVEKQDHATGHTCVAGECSECDPVWSKKRLGEGPTDRPCCTAAYARGYEVGRNHRKAQ